LESILEAIYEGFVFIGHADPAAKVEHRIVIVQGQNLQKGLQFFDVFPDAWWIVFMGFCNSLPVFYFIFSFAVLMEEMSITRILVHTESRDLYSSSDM
jgi:hypothetical protein